MDAPTVTVTEFVRIFSVDPGIDNVGLCVMDGNFNVIELLATPLPDALGLRRLHKEQRTEWVTNLCESITSWLSQYVLPRMLPFGSGPILVIIEENDHKLPYTKDFAAVLCGLLYSNRSVRTHIITVLPMNVAAWMHREGLPSGSSRAQKKTWTLKYVADLPLAPNHVERMILTPDSADAAANAYYVRHRFYGGSGKSRKSSA